MNLWVIIFSAVVVAHIGVISSFSISFGCFLQFPAKSMKNSATPTHWKIQQQTKICRNRRKTASHFWFVQISMCQDPVEFLQCTMECHGTAPDSTQSGVESPECLRNIQMPRGKNRLPPVLRQFLTCNYPRPDCLLRCIPVCLSLLRQSSD